MRTQSQSLPPNICENKKPRILAKDPQYNDTKAKLAAFMPKTNQQPVGGGEEKKEQKREKKKKMKEK